MSKTFLLLLLFKRIFAIETYCLMLTALSTYVCTCMHEVENFYYFPINDIAIKKIQLKKCVVAMTIANDVVSFDTSYEYSFFSSNFVVSFFSSNFVCRVEEQSKKLKI